MKEKLPARERMSTPEAQEAAFWKKEMEEWLENKDENYKNKTEAELYSSLVNNIHGWLPNPGIKGSYTGAKRTEDALEFWNEVDPEEYKTIQKLIADVDAYITKNNLQDFVRGHAEQQSQLAQLTSEAVQTRDMSVLNKFKPNLTSGEILEFKKDLYYAMRQKGYSGTLLRT
jgi:hypothetical protein